MTCPCLHIVFDSILLLIQQIATIMKASVCGGQPQATERAQQTLSTPSGSPPPPPPGGGLLLMTSCCTLAAYVCSKVTIRWCCAACVPTCFLGLENRSRPHFVQAGTLRPGLSYNVLLHPCLHVMFAMCSEPSTCLSTCAVPTMTVRHAVIIVLTK